MKNAVLLVIIVITVAIASNQRQKRQGLFSIVSFPNDPCRGKNNLNGTCVSGSECQGLGGQAQGSCAQGFGTCCYFETSACGGDIIRNQTYINNPGYPSTYTVSTDTTCDYKIIRINSNVCQVRFDFTVFDLGIPFFTGATQFECVDGSTDYVSFTPAGNKANGLELCGLNTGLHVYVDFGTTNASPDFVKMTMSFDATNQADYKRTYSIMASQIECNTNYYAPIGCDQYFYGNGGTGTITSFNFDQTDSSAIARLKSYYTTCIRREENMCQISYTPPDTDSDSLGFTINGNPSTVKKGKVGCGNPSPGPGMCTNAYIRIPQGTETGEAPYITPAPPTPAPNTLCDRFCGRRLCFVMNGCSESESSTIISKFRPFQITYEGRSHTTNFVNKGFQLNYAQYRC